MNVDPDLIARLRKILARTEQAGCTPGEAEAAYGMAAALMARHNLEMAQVEQAGGLDGDGWTQAVAAEAGRWSSEFDLAAGICRSFFFVSTFRTNTLDARGKVRPSMMLFGSPTNVETARFVFSSLLAATDRLWREHFAAGTFPRSDRRAFVAAVINGFGEKLAAERAAMIADRDRDRDGPGTALALKTIDEKTLEAMLAIVEGLREIKAPPLRFYGSQEAIDAGLAAGKALNLSRPIGSDAEPRGLPSR